MRRMVIYLCTMFVLFAPNADVLTGAYDTAFTNENKIGAMQSITPMEALDQVKERYAANFIKVYTKESVDEYYYKLPFADYYLVYEGAGETENDYIYHLYEFVVDEQSTGIGHTVTYGWYTFCKESGTITKY